MESFIVVGELFKSAGLLVIPEVLGDVNFMSMISNLEKKAGL